MSELSLSLLEQRDYGFNLPRAKQCALTYSHSININCIVIDAQGKTLFDSDMCDGTCKLCRKYCEMTGRGLSCSKIHLYGSYQADRFGGKYIFFCPFGLTHWVAPINIDGFMRGALIAGPVLMMDPDEFLFDDMLIKHNVDKEHYEDIKQYVKQIPIVKPEAVSDFAELLFITASHLSNSNSDKFLEDRDMQEQQGDISQYINYIKTMGGSESEGSAYPIEKERELLSLIALGDKEGSKKILNEILGYIFFSTSRNFELVKARILELVVLLSRAALEGGADVEEIFGLNYNYLKQIDNFKTIEELTHWLSKIMIRFSDFVFNLKDVKHVDIIYKAIEFIKKNYMQKLSLEEVAAHVYLSASYFSKIFKEEMKVNFNTYLNNFRIEMSKKLLLDDSISLVDVSSIVGFEDQSYFSKVFKKVTDISPGKYRESRGKY